MELQARRALLKAFFVQANKQELPVRLSKRIKEALKYDAIGCTTTRLMEVKAIVSTELSQQTGEDTHRLTTLQNLSLECDRVVIHLVEGERPYESTFLHTDRY